MTAEMRPTRNTTLQKERLGYPLTEETLQKVRDRMRLVQMKLAGGLPSREELEKYRPKPGEKFYRNPRMAVHSHHDIAHGAVVSLMGMIFARREEQEQSSQVVSDDVAGFFGKYHDSQRNSDVVDTIIFRRHGVIAARRMHHGDFPDIPTRDYDQLGKLFEDHDRRSIKDFRKPIPEDLHIMRSADRSDRVRFYEYGPLKALPKNIREWIVETAFIKRKTLKDPFFKELLLPMTALFYLREYYQKKGMDGFDAVVQSAQALGMIV